MRSDAIIPFESNERLNETTPLSGVFPVISTPFLEDDSVDREHLGIELDWLIDQGVDGVAIAMVSEILRLDVAERIELTRWVCECVAGRVPVVASVGAESDVVAARLAVAAQEAGAAALMAIPPVAVKLPDRTVQAYFASLIESVSIPLIVQDASGYLGHALSLELQADLLQQYGADRVQFKPEAQPIGPRLTGLLELTKHQARVFEGTGGLALAESYQRGIVGTMPGAEVPWAIVAMWRALESADLARASEIQGPLSSLISMQSTLDSFVSVEKYLLVKQGVFTSARARTPSGFALDRQSANEVDRLFGILRRVVDN